MGIALISLDASTSTNDVLGFRHPGNTGQFPLAENEFEVGDTLLLDVADAAVTDLPVGQLVRITTTPVGRFIADGTVTTVGSSGDNAAGRTPVTVEIQSVATAFDSTAGSPPGSPLTSLGFTPLTRGTVTNGSHTVTTAQSGFVQAVYTGVTLSTNAHERGLTISFGPSGEETTYQLRAGVPLPDTATITNINDEQFNILINNG